MIWSWIAPGIFRNAYLWMYNFLSSSHMDLFSVNTSNDFCDLCLIRNNKPIFSNNRYRFQFSYHIKTRRRKHSL